MRILGIKTAWNNFQMLLIISTVFTLGLFFGSVYHIVLENYYFPLMVIGSLAGITFLFIWIKKMFEEPHMEQLP